MENEIALLRFLLINQNQNNKQQLSSTLEWNGELNLNHPGIEALAKSLHKKYKDVELPSDFNFSVPAGRGANKLNEAKILWTNLTTIIRIILDYNKDSNYCNSDFYILGIVLNMCVLLAEKRDLAVVKSHTDEETAKLFKSMRGANNFMIGSNASIMNQAISMRETQVRIGVNVPRQRNWNN